MSIYQINLFICEICGKISKTCEEETLYSDPVIENPNGEEWDYIIINGVEKLACPECMKNHVKG